MMSENYARNKKMEDGNLVHNELCTLEMEWLPSLYATLDFINLFLHNGYGAIIEPIFDENGKVDSKLLVTILDK